MAIKTSLHASRFRLRQCTLALAAAALLLGARPAKADLVTDGGFESASGGTSYGQGQSLDGAWTVTTGVVYIDSADPYVYDGQNSLNLTLFNLESANTVSQTLTTTMGQEYTVSFYGNADTPNAFSLTQNGTAVSGAPLSIVDNGFPDASSNSSQFEDYSLNFTATSASTVLSFTDTGDPTINTDEGSVMIDDVSVQAVTATTPEPESMVLVFTGALGLAGVLRRRFVRSSAC